MQPPGGRRRTRWIKSVINHVHSQTMANIFFFSFFLIGAVNAPRPCLVSQPATTTGMFLNVTQFDKTRRTYGADGSLRLPILVNIQRTSPLLSSSLITWDPFVAQLRFIFFSPPHSALLQTDDSLAFAFVLLGWTEVRLMPSSVSI